MVYRDNVTALANKLGISNDPGLCEEDLGIAQLRFCNSGMEVLTTIEASSMNRGGRLFFQYHAQYPENDPRHGLRRNVIEHLYELQKPAQEYFAELWEPNPEPGKRALLDAIRNPKHYEVEIVWK